MNRSDHLKRAKLGKWSYAKFSEGIVGFEEDPNTLACFAVAKKCRISCGGGCDLYPQCCDLAPYAWKLKLDNCVVVLEESGGS